MHIICVSYSVHCILECTLEYILGVDNGSHFLIGWIHDEKRV